MRAFLRRIVVYALIITAVLLLLSVLLVLPFKWLNPPVTMVIADRWLSADYDYPIQKQWLDWDDIPKHAALAVVTSEDQRFPNHMGFDVEAIQQALKEWEQRGELRGASTISQQVARNMYLWTGRSWLRKGIEAWFTLLIEFIWGKQRILEIYLNIAEWGHYLQLPYPVRCVTIRHDLLIICTGVPSGIWSSNASWVAHSGWPICHDGFAACNSVICCLVAPGAEQVILLMGFLAI